MFQLSSEKMRGLLYLITIIGDYCIYHGWPTYPHVRYPHDKYSLNMGLLLTIVVPLMSPY